MKLEKDKEYILKISSTVKDYLVEYDSEKMFLHSKRSDSEVIASYENFIESKKSFLNISNDNKPINFPSCFPKLMATMQVELYNDEDYMKKYPKGFFTPSKLMIPLNLYQRIEKIKGKPFSYLYLFSHIFTKMLEHKYDFKCEEEDYNKISKDLLGNIIKSDYNFFNQKYLKDVKLEFVSDEEFINDIKKKQFSERTIKYFEASKSDGDYIDNIILKSLEGNDPKHPFNIIQTKITKLDISFNDSEKQELVQNSNSGYEKFYNPEFMLKALNFTHETIQNCEKNLNSTNANEKIKELGDNLKPFLFDLSNIQFSAVISSCGNFILQKLSTSEIKSFAANINSDPRCTATFRSELIETITSNNTMRAKNAKVMEKPFYNALVKYTKACGEGNIEEIKEILSIYPEMINDKEAITTIFKNGKVEVLDYLLTNTELKDEPQFKEELNEHLSLTVSNQILDLLINHKSIDKLDYYKGLLNVSINNNRKDTLEYLLSLDPDNNLNSIKTYGLYKACTGYGYNLENIRILTEHLSHYAADNRFKEDIWNNIKNACGVAADKSSDDILRYFIFDYKFKFSDDLSKDFDPESNAYKSITKLLYAKNLHEELHVELNANSKSSNKKIKL